ncbi:ankyrin repeat domain-containing protein [Wolbachia endosymbiont (group A) of Sicus ferrugineus]|uniref:ankyrin repeat domain-containing protein n=1 Tax=Wolbachia endosymbiont (group A) of Sicus ferrugineus TaxID=2954056 RepID=UPI0022326B7E|nr:ankyrin repeat domain-containing protein [Wolbachia endosymbiont (group A) of Sicus ferrugineus]
MQYEQWKRILSAIDKETNLSKDNVIEKIKKRLEEESKYEHKKWGETNFNVNCSFIRKNGLLHLAVQNNLKGVVNALLGVGGIDVNSVNEDKRTPLHSAIQYVCKETVKTLIGAGASVNAQDKEGKTPLHYAAEHGHTQIAKVLLKRGANVNSADKDKCTPLYSAIQYGCEETVKTLIGAGASVNSADEDERTPLHIATHFPRKKIVKILVEAGADVNATDKYGRSPLHFAKGVETVEALIRAGANVNAQDKEGKTPLHYGRDQETVKTLIGAGADVNAVDKDKCTPLHMAARRGCKEVIETLIEKRADLLSNNNDNKIPIDFDKNHYIIRHVESLWSEERMKRLDQNNKIAFVIFCSTILFGTAVATTLFVTEKIAFGLYPIIGAVVIVAAAAWAVSCATAKILEPNTKVEETKEVQVNGDVPAPSRI